MMVRTECSVTGAVIDHQRAGREAWFVSCGDCSWNHTTRRGMFADAEQLLVEHYEAEHDESPEFFWHGPDVPAVAS